MADNETREVVTLGPKVERYFQSARSAVSDHRAGFGNRLEVYFAGLRGELTQAGEEIARHERECASRFDVFAYLQPDENCLSDVLADLLDPKGSHGQGATFLGLLAKQIGIDLPVAVGRVKVYREEQTSYLANPLRRIDVLVDFGTFGLGIENKPWAGEQPGQIRDYLKHLRGQYAEGFVLVYLSGNGMPPSSVEREELARFEAQGQFRLLDYQNGLASWLMACASACQAESVRWFLRAFQAYTRANFRTVEADGGGEG